MEEEKEDRISSLPECLLLEIISRIKIRMPYAVNERKLDTREVIRTIATVSKQWQHLWTRLPNLEICARGYDDDFACIDKALTQCPTNVNLKKIKLENDYLRTSQVVCSLIRHAINRNVQEVDLSISPCNQEVFSYDDELFFNNSCFTSMDIANCAFIPPNGAIRWDNLKHLCISHGKLVDDSIGKILLGSPCLETLVLRQCYGVRQIDATSKRFKNLVLTDYTFWYHTRKDHINTIKVNAPHMLSLTIHGNLCLEKLLLLNVSSLVKVDLCYQVHSHLADKLGQSTLDDIEEELLGGLLSSLSHINEILLGSTCPKVLSCLKAKGFQFLKMLVLHLVDVGDY